jgi:hypothetical protein
MEIPTLLRQPSPVFEDPDEVERLVELFAGQDSDSDWVPDEEDLALMRETIALETEQMRALDASGVLLDDEERETTELERPTEIIRSPDEIASVAGRGGGVVGPTLLHLGVRKVL